MKAQLLKLPINPLNSFSIREDFKPNIQRLHYHPEIELIQIKKGTGTHFIGDSFKAFKSGDIFLIGSQLPHYLKYDGLEINEPIKPLTESRVLQFSENFWGDAFLNLPENKIIRNLLEQSKKGIKINGLAKIKVSEYLDKLFDAEGPERILLLLLILHSIACSNDYSLISTTKFNHDVSDMDNQRMKIIYKYTLSNFKRKIQLEELAKIAHMSPPSFCRYFKSRTNKTYTQFLFEIKVSQACKLLMKGDLSIKELYYESGFASFSSFHKNFKQITGLSPLSYKKEIKL
jgi:AraC-like DNA-binding protein